VINIWERREYALTHLSSYTYVRPAAFLLRVLYVASACNFGDPNILVMQPLLIIITIPRCLVCGDRWEIRVGVMDYKTNKTGWFLWFNRSVFNKIFLLILSVYRPINFCFSNYGWGTSLAVLWPATWKQKVFDLLKLVVHGVTLLGFNVMARSTLFLGRWMRTMHRTIGGSLIIGGD
jgi:hypothetical protein